MKSSFIYMWLLWLNFFQFILSAAAIISLHRNPSPSAIKFPALRGQVPTAILNHWRQRWSRACLLLKDRLVNGLRLLLTLSFPRATVQASPTGKERKHHSRMYGLFWKKFSGKKDSQYRERVTGVPTTRFWLQNVFCCCNYPACYSVVYFQINKVMCCGKVSRTAKTRVFPANICVMQVSL